MAHTATVAPAATRALIALAFCLCAWTGADAAAHRSPGDTPRCGGQALVSRMLRLAEGSSRSCSESCVAQCRSAERACGGKPDCRAQFQICARRCVVSCGSR